MLPLVVYRCDLLCCLLRSSLDAILDFFKTDEQIEISRLQAQASARADQFRRMAQLQLQALSKSRYAAQRQQDQGTSCGAGTPLALPPVHGHLYASDIIMAMPSHALHTSHCSLYMTSQPHTHGCLCCYPAGGGPSCR